jgi:hypothetical protein
MGQTDSLLRKSLEEPGIITIDDRFYSDGRFTRNQTYYVYNGAKDTILLSAINLAQFNFCQTPRIVDSVQINGTGAKEIVFSRNCRGETSDHGGTFDITEKAQLHKYEVWDLDAQQLLFEVNTYYDMEYNRFKAYADPSHARGSDHYQCDFAIDDAGTITISKLRGKSSELAAKKEGEYVFRNGQYTMVE